MESGMPAHKISKNYESRESARIGANRRESFFVALWLCGFVALCEKKRSDGVNLWVIRLSNSEWFVLFSNGTG